MDGLILQDPYRMGYLGTWIMVQHLQGYDVAANGKVLGTGEHIITRDNLEALSTRELFDPALRPSGNSSCRYFHTITKERKNER